MAGRADHTGYGDTGTVENCVERGLEGFQRKTAAHSGYGDLHGMVYYYVKLGSAGTVKDYTEHTGTVM